MYTNTSMPPTMKIPMTTHFPISSAKEPSTTFPKQRPSTAMTAATTIAVQIAKRLQKVRLSIITQSIRAETVSLSRSDLHPFKISSSPNGSYASSLHSRLTALHSSASTVCHWPMDGQLSSRLDHAEHPLRLIRRRISHFQVHP